MNTLELRAACETRIVSRRSGIASVEDVTTLAAASGVSRWGAVAASSRAGLGNLFNLNQQVIVKDNLVRAHVANHTDDVQKGSGTRLLRRHSPRQNHVTSQ